MKIFVANSRRVDAEDCASPTAGSVQFPPIDYTPVEPSPDIQLQRSAEPGSSSPHHADSRDADRCGVNIDDSYPTSIADAVPVEQRRENLSPHRYPSTSAAHASHCANPVCLRRVRAYTTADSAVSSPLDRSSASLRDMCSHRLALSGSSQASSSSNHARLRPQRPQHSSHDATDADCSLTCRLLATGASRMSNRRGSASSRMSPDVSYGYSTLPTCGVIDSEAYSPTPRPRARRHTPRRAAALEAQSFYVSTLPPRHQRLTIGRQSTPPLTGGRLSGSSSALDIRDLETSSSSPHGATLCAKSPQQSTAVACTSLHDILSPPFAARTANGPKPSTGKAALTLKPGHQDEFGTAV